MKNQPKNWQKVVVVVGYDYPVDWLARLLFPFEQYIPASEWLAVGEKKENIMELVFAIFTSMLLVSMPFLSAKMVQNNKQYVDSTLVPNMILIIFGTSIMPVLIFTFYAMYSFDMGLLFGKGRPEIIMTYWEDNWAWYMLMGILLAFVFWKVNKPET